MAANLGTLTLDLIAKVGGFVAGMDKASRSSKKTSAEIRKHAKAIGVAFGAAASTAAIALVAMVNQQRKVIDAQSKLAQALGGSITGLEALARAGGRAGVSQEDLRAASTRLNQALGEVLITNTGKAKAALDKLGLSARALSDMDVDQRFAAIAGRLTEMGVSTQVAAKLLRDFGIRQSSVIVLMQAGAGAIEESRRKIEAYGVALSDVDAAKVEEMNDALSELTIIQEGLANQLTVELAPAITAITKLFINQIEEIGGVGTAVRDMVRASLENIALLVNGLDILARATGLPRAALKTIFSGFDTEVARGGIEKLKGTFTEPLDGQKLLTFYDEAQEKADEAAKALIEQRKALRGLGGAADASIAEASKESQAAAKALLKAFESAETGYLRQIALLKSISDGQKEASEVAKLAFEIESGNLVGINALQQKRLNSLAAEIDQLELLKKAREEARETAQFTQALDDQIALAQNAIDIEVESIGLGEKRADQLRAINRIQQEYAKSIEDLARAQGTADALSEEAFQRRIAALKDAMDEEVKIVEEGERRKEEARKDALKGAKGAVEDYIDDANNLAAQTNGLVMNTLGNLEDALVDFAKTGKLSFDDLANSIINDILRIGAKQLTANLAGGLLGALGGGAGAGGGAGGGFAGLFDHGGNIGSGQWGIVGENGPEIVQGPAAVTGRRETAAKLDRAISRVEQGRNDSRVMQRDGDVYMTVVTPDANSFRKSERQVSHSLRRGLNQ